MFTGVAGGTSLTYHFTEEKNVYLKYSRGWKPGHFNGGAVFSGQIIEPVRPEIVDSYEAGLRSCLVRRSAPGGPHGVLLRLPGPPGVPARAGQPGLPDLQQLVNAEEAEIYGVELDLHASPIEGLDLRFHMSFLESEYGKFGQTIYVAGPGDPPPGGNPEIREIPSTTPATA